MYKVIFGLIKYHQYFPNRLKLKLNLVTWRVALVEQWLPTLQEHLRSPPVFSGVRVARTLVFCVVFSRSLFVPFLLGLALSVLWFTDCDYPVGIFKLLFNKRYRGSNYLFSSYLVNKPLLKEMALLDQQPSYCSTFLLGNPLYELWTVYLNRNKNTCIRKGVEPKLLHFTSSFKYIHILFTINPDTFA